MSSPVRLGLFAASPVHYQIPLYRRLAADPRIDFTAIFASTAGVRPYDGGYGRPVRFDLDLLEGYRSIFLKSAHRNPSGGDVLALRDWDIVRLVRSGRYDSLWLHGYHTVTHILAAIAQRTTGGGLIYREDATLIHRRPTIRRAVKALALPAFFYGAHAVFIGTENRRWWRRWGIPPGRLFFAPYAVDNDRLQRGANGLRYEGRALRHAFGIADDAGPVILSVSRLVPQKDPLLLLEAFRRVRAQVPCALLIVGSGPLEARMRAEVRAKNILDVAFAGFLDQKQIGRAYACADVFVLPSRIEPWGLVVNEAMNFALPVVASTNVGCAVDLVRAGETGFVVPAGEPAELAQALRTLVESEPLRRRMGVAGRALISEWTIEGAAEGIVNAAIAAAGTRATPKLIEAAV